MCMLKRDNITYLHNTCQVTLGSELQALFLRPHLNSLESTYQSLACGPRTQCGVVCNQTVEQPLVDEVKQLRKQLDCQCSVHPCTQ